MSHATSRSVSVLWALGVSFGLCLLQPTTSHAALIVRNVTPSPNAVTGALFQTNVTFSVCNTSATQSFFRYQIFYGDTATVSGLTLLYSYTGTFLRVGGGSGTNCTTVQNTVGTPTRVSLPRNVLFGKRYIHVGVDEFPVGGNLSYGNGSLTITGKPDLQVLNSFSAAPSQLTPGSSTTLTYRLYNAGRSRTDVPFKVSFYYSNDTTLSTTSDTLLASVAVSNDLNALTPEPATTNGTVSVTIPSSAPAGKRYIFAYVDFDHTSQSGSIDEGSLENNNTRALSLDVVQPELNMQTWTAASSTPGAGNTVTVNYTLRNQGGADAGAFTVSFYYGDSTSTTGLTKLSDVSIPSLAANSSSPRTVVLTMPNDVLYGSRFLHYFIDSGNSQKESNEINNRDYRRLFISGRPDLHFSAFSIAPTSQVPGGTVTISYRIRNSGLSRVNTSYSLRFYDSIDGVITTTDTPLKTLVVPGPLNARSSGQSATENVTVLASAPPGRRYIGGYIDYTRAIVESNDNNNTGSTSLTVTSTGAPDLVMESFTSPPSARGYLSSITVQFKVKNQGTGNAGPFRVTFYYGDSATPTGLTARRTVLIPSLAQGASTATLGATFTLPATVLYGARFLHYWIDDQGVINESNETNNRGSNPLQITGKPDLQIRTTSQFSVSPTSQRAGGNLSVSYRIYNLGYSRVPSFKARLYYSGDPLLDTNDTYLNVEIAGNMNALGYYPNSANGSTSVTLPATAAPGTRYIGLLLDWDKKVDESDENNNAITRAITVLQAELSMESWSSPSTAAGHGTPISITFKIRNSGNLDSGPFALSFYYGKSAAATGLVPIHTQTIPNLSSSSSTSTTTISVSLPKSVVKGGGFLHYFIDSGGAVAESDEGNNRGSRAIQVTGSPNLQVSVLSVAPTTSAPGQSVTLTYRVYNAGATRAEGNFITRFYYSNDATIDTTDTYLGQQAITSGLDADTYDPPTSSTTVSVTLPLSALAGARFLGAIVDYDAKISESDEKDNSKSTPITITGSPDLVADAVTATPNKQQRGKSVTITYTVKNDGNQNAAATTLRIYYSTDATITTADTLLTTINLTPGLQAKTSVQGSATVTLPASLAAGAGYVGIFVDPTNTISESSETNNTTSTSFTVLVDVDQDGFTNDVDCNDNEKAINPSAKEICDGKDNNCDGKVDEGCSCQNGKTQSCYTGPAGTDGKGECKKGTQTCTNGQWGTCVGEVVPIKEICDGKDNNCDGQNDENISVDCYTGPAGTDGKGECKKGTQSCQNGKLTTCTNEVVPGAEICDGKDNNCDGQIDEQVTQSCYSGPAGTDGKGECKKGTQTCINGKFDVCTNEITPQAEICDQRDNDCDGLVDEEGVCAKEAGGESSGEGGSFDAGPGDAPPTDAPAPDSGLTCGGLKCSPGQGCRDGLCADSCGCITCQAGERCVDGQCQQDPCATVKCGNGETCTPHDGQCSKDPCAKVQCPSDMSCDAGQCVGRSCGEKTDEPGAETTGETSSEPTADGGSQDNGNADTSGEPQSDAKSGDTGSPDPSAGDDPGSGEKTTGTDAAGSDTGTTPPPTGCCQTGTQDHLPFYLLLFLLCALVPSYQRRRKN